MLHRQNPLAALLIATAIGVTILPSRADFWTGNDLIKWCTEYKYGASAGAPACTGYIMAIVDVMAEGKDTVLGWKACIPAGVSSDQVRDVTIGYLSANIPKRHLGAPGLIAEAMAEAFPCSK
jgi:hypothetical protein